MKAAVCLGVFCASLTVPAAAKMICEDLDVATLSTQELDRLLPYPRALDPLMKLDHIGVCRETKTFKVEAISYGGAPTEADIVKLINWFKNSGHEHKLFDAETGEYVYDRTDVIDAKERRSIFRVDTQKDGVFGMFIVAEEVVK